MALTLVPEADGREALGASLVKTLEHRRALDVVADLFLPGLSPTSRPAGARETRIVGVSDTGPLRDRTRPERAADDTVRRGPEEGLPLAQLSEESLSALLLRALSTSNDALLDLVAAELVDRHAGLDASQPVAGRLAALRVFRAARPEDLRHVLLGESSSSSGTSVLEGLIAMCWIRQVDGRIEDLRQAIEAQVRGRLADRRGAVEVARAIQQSLPGEDDLNGGNRSNAVETNALIDALQRRISGALEHSPAPSPAGKLDPRRTARRALGTGGVPLDPAFRPRRPPRPLLFVLADISGSVAAFARFTLSLTARLHDRYGQIRSFVFVDEVDEVSDLFSPGNRFDLATVAQKLDGGRRGIRYEPHSDYGRAFTTFENDYGNQLGANSAVLILGDGRNNHRAPHAERLRRIRNRTGRLWWLNPERRATWGDGDSEMSTYAPLCDGAFECRNARQLGKILAGLR